MEYKYVVRGPRAVWWEGGGNRSVVVAEGVVTCSDAWVREGAGVGTGGANGQAVALGANLPQIPSGEDVRAEGAPRKEPSFYLLDRIFKTISGRHDQGS